ncbi:MAG: MATE family efflux transporter [Lachnospiraceae bacterium]|nr:MATE family efflux transporter [Lachnospiraceae bacterium]
MTTSVPRRPRGDNAGRLFDRNRIDFSDLLFDSISLKKLLLPLIVEQLLTSFMGMADTMMISRVGSAAISAVSLVDSINILVIQVFAALATGGTIVCSQYIGHGDKARTNSAARQVVLTILFISCLAAAACMIFCTPILRLVFGTVEEAVMRNSQVYFLVTAASFPFLALFQAGAAFYRAGGNSRFPMTVSVICNAVNIAGNAIFIFVFHWGVFGAALSTLISRILLAVIVFAFLRLPRQIIVIDRYLSMRPDFTVILKILSVGIPAGIESGMFQFGKLAIQSSVSTLGTAAIAAQAMTNILENLNGIAGIGIGLGLMTVVGQCIGAGRTEEAKYYIVKIYLIGEAAVTASCLFVYAITRPVVWLAGMEPASADMCIWMMGWITLVKPVVWSAAFIVPYGFRGAGDVKFNMIMSSLSMWLCRVVLATILIRVCGFGPIAVWIGMFSDWTIRAIIHYFRFRSGRWLNHAVI